MSEHYIIDLTYDDIKNLRWILFKSRHLNLREEVTHTRDKVLLQTLEWMRMARERNGKS